MDALAAADNSVAKDARVAAFWGDYCRAAKLAESTPYQAWYFGDTQELAHELVELVLHGPKRATAGLSELVSALPEVAPVPAGYSVVTEHDGTPRAVIRTAALDRRPFAGVDAAFAWDEGEGDRTLDDWKDGHRSYFTRELAALGRKFDEDMLVDLERFELLYPFEAAHHPVDCGPRILPGYFPGAFAQSAALQMAYYWRDHAFDWVFESARLADLGAFVGRYDAARDGVWMLVDGGCVHGSIVVDASGEVPELRWYIVDDALRGKGFGHRLMATAMDFCRERFARVHLHTFSALGSARRLYEAFGFRLIAEHPDTSCGPTILQQGFEWTR
jgi:uncharacterized protein YhfF/GNAT superfamily N-acetyltransferase